LAQFVLISSEDQTDRKTDQSCVIAET